MGAQARQDRRVQPAAERRHRHELHRAGRRAGHPAVGALLHHARYRHAPAARRRESSSIGIIAHPLNRPRFDARLGRVTEGYGILQPRVSVTMASAAGSLFARTYAGHTGVDPYTTAVSDVYQDLFDEGIFTGKGLYDVDAFVGVARGPRAGERAAVARSLRGPLRADGARHRRRGRRRLSVERPRAREAPAPLGARRLADPVVALSVRAVARRACSATACRSSSRWKILDNLRRSLMAPATVAAARCSAGPSCRALRSSWTAIGLAAVALPVVLRLLQLLRGPARLESGPAFLRTALDDLEHRLSSASSLQLAFLANQAYEMLHAITVTLVRLGHHQAPAARVGDGRGQRRPRRAAAPDRVREGDDRQPARSRSAAWSLVVADPSARAARGGAGARAVGGGAARSRTRSAGPCRPAARCSAPRIASFSQSVARKTWQYFETFVGRRGSRAPARQRPARPGR